MVDQIRATVKTTDPEIISILRAQKNRNAYILQAIRFYHKWGIRLKTMENLLHEINSMLGDILIANKSEVSRRKDVMEPQESGDSGEALTPCALQLMEALSELYG